LAEGSLYRIDAQHQVVKMAEGICIPNSLAWSPDDRTMYFADTFKRAIYAYSFDIDTGSISNQRVFARFAEGSGAPDGSTVDAEGFLWNAVYGGGRLHCYAPNGRLHRSVELPMSQPTSCAFGGTDLNTLYVTSASQRLRAEQLAREPFAGAIIAIDVGVKGLPEPQYVG
jgi:sugar lactone lactonase YvrE